jgi:hypothetical protein
LSYEKIWLISLGCLATGLVIGAFCGIIYTTKQFAEALALLKASEMSESGERAFQAYQHESNSIAIYALTQDLKIPQDAKELGNNPFFATPTEIQRRLMFNHARLAKLLAESGQTNASMTHIAEALKYAQETSTDPNVIARFSSVTNEMQLFETLAKFDQKGVP